MINDDELDKLLSDVESGSDFHKAREESLMQKQRTARKADMNLGDGEGELPEEQFIHKIQKFGIDNDILTFSKGILPALNNHNLFTQRFKRTLSEFTLPENIQQIVQKYKYTFMRSSENIEKLYNDFSIILSLDSLTRESRKNFSLYFQGFEEENKLNFLVLKEIFIKLREFNSRAKKEWSELSNSISVFNLATDAKPLYQELNSLIAMAVNFGEATDKFLKRISIILSIPDDDYDVLEKEIYKKIIYRQTFEYRYDLLFDESGYTAQIGDTAEEIDGIPEITGSRPREFSARNESSKAVNIREKTGGPDEPVDSIERMAAQNRGNRDNREAFKELPYTIKGTGTWNTREPYIIPVSQEKLEKEYEELGYSFFFIGTLEDGHSQEGAVKRAMIRYLSDPSKTIITEYEEYIYKTIINTIEEMKRFFGIQGVAASLFVYHLGPMTVYRQILNVFQFRKVGVCFKYVSGNKVVRFIPGEFIKEKVLHWFEENINTLNLEFDKIQHFDEIRRIVVKKYTDELDKYNKQLDELVKKFKIDESRQMDRMELFKSKWNQWFGAENIVVYNRFIEKTVFKQ